MNRWWTSSKENPEPIDVEEMKKKYDECRKEPDWEKLLKQDLKIRATMLKRYFPDIYNYWKKEWKEEEMRDRQIAIEVLDKVEEFARQQEEDEEKVSITINTYRKCFEVATPKGLFLLDMNGTPI